MVEGTSAGVIVAYVQRRNIQLWAEIKERDSRREQKRMSWRHRPHHHRALLIHCTTTAIPNSLSLLCFLYLSDFLICSCSGRCSTFKSPSDSVCPDFHNFWDQILVVRLFMFTVLCRNDHSHIYFLFSIVFRIFLILFPSLYGCYRSSWYAHTYSINFL